MPVTNAAQPVLSPADAIDTALRVPQFVGFLGTVNLEQSNPTYWYDHAAALWHVGVITSGYPNVTLHAFGPVDAVGTMFRFSLYSAIIIGLPVIMHQIWMFIVPAIHPKTRNLVYKLIVPSIGLAMVGILFAHFVVIPVVVKGTTLLTNLIATETYGIGSTLNLVFFAGCRTLASELTANSA